MYKVRISKQASKFILTLNKKDQEKINDRIKQLSISPRNEGVIKLTNVDPDTYRARQGDYRIIFHIIDDELIVDVIDINHRKEAYRR